MILHFILNSFFVFIVLALFIEFLFFIFQINNKRIRYICRLLPLLKIPFDTFVFVIFEKSFFMNLNPLSCEIYVYELLSQWFSFGSLDSDVPRHLVIPQYLAKQFPESWLDALTGLTIAFGVGGIIWKLFQWHWAKIHFSGIFQSAVENLRPLDNFLLERDLVRHRIKILHSPEVKIPFAVCPSYIVIPSKVTHLTDDEYAAIVAHELQHLKWKDPLWRFALSFFHSFFWWIPDRWWLNRVIQEQEEACDASMQRYEIENLSLATAIRKIAGQDIDLKLDFKDSDRLLMNALLGFSKKLVLERVKILLNANHGQSSPYYVREGIAVLFSILVFVSFWMC